MSPVLQVRNLAVQYRGQPLRTAKRSDSTNKEFALSNVSFDISAGECFGVIGASGAGKSSLARSILQAPPPTSGTVRFLDNELTALRGRKLHAARRGIQMIFQDPAASLNPKWPVSRIVEEPLLTDGTLSNEERQQKVATALSQVGIEPREFLRRLPHQLSGGQCQRVAIARSIVETPRLIICDEAVSSLDSPIQVQILRLLKRLCNENKISLLYISHDLHALRHFCHRIAVIHKGSVCEVSTPEVILDRPTHQETRKLVAAANLLKIPAPAN